MNFKLDKSTIILVLSNSIPLFGVLFFGWDLFSILVLYWSENLIVGFFNIFKILLAQGKIQKNIGSASATVTKGFLAVFFALHYGGFTFVHGMFVFGLFGQYLLQGDASLRLFGIFYGALGLFVSHGWSFFENFLGKKEYEKLPANIAMFLPYGRIVVLHLTILFGAFLILIFGSPLAVLILLIFLKIILDLGAHRREHLKIKNIISTPLIVD